MWLYISYYNLPSIYIYIYIYAVIQYTVPNRDEQGIYDYIWACVYLHDGSHKIYIVKISEILRITSDQVQVNMIDAI